jgi:hypothetical protein
VKLVDLKKQGGVGGMIGGLGEGLAAKQVDNNTPVRVIRSDEKGSQVEVLDGAFKGMNGFVAQDNVHLPSNLVPLPTQEWVTPNDPVPLPAREGVRG